MQFYFQAGELAYVNRLLVTLCQASPNRKVRRNLARLAGKFDCGQAIYVWLKPSDRLGLIEILNHGSKALDNTRSQFGQRGFFNKTKSVLGIGSEVEHLEKAEGVLASVLSKITNGPNGQLSHI